MNEATVLEYKPKGPIHWNSNIKIFTYASDAGIGIPKKEVILKFQGKTIKFKQTIVDKDGSREVIYVCNYDSVEGVKFL